MKQGFFTALGTPLDEQGEVCEASFAAQINDQLQAGASGLLIMGSMGNEPYIRNSAYKAVAAAAVKANAGKSPVLVGVMDTSIGRVCDRIDELSDLKLDGVVSTVPYYFGLNQDQVQNFYTALADYSKFPVYIYDLPTVTKTRIMPKTIKQLSLHSNIRGIKSGNLETVRTLCNCKEMPVNFDIVYSGLDTFDIAYQYGINKNLDGMFACTPKTTHKMYTALAGGRYSEAGKHLDDIVGLRDLFAASGTIMGAFTYAMNAIGYAGCYTFDYDTIPDENWRNTIVDRLKILSEI